MLFYRVEQRIYIYENINLFWLACGLREKSALKSRIKMCKISHNKANF